MQAGNEAVETDIDLETGEVIEKSPVEVLAGERKEERLGSSAATADRGIPSVAENNSKANWKALVFFVPLIAVIFYWVFRDDEVQATSATVIEEEKPAGFSPQYKDKSRNIMEEWLANNPPLGPPSLPEPKEVEPSQPQATSGDEGATKANKPPVVLQRTTTAASKPSAPKGMVTKEQLYAMASTPMGNSGGRQASSRANNGNFPLPGSNPYAPVDSSNLEQALMGALTPKAPDNRDSNLQFRDRVSNQEVEKVQARQLTDMDYMVLQGTFIHVSLDTAIDSTLPGEVRGTVAKNVYGVSGSKVLIPRGSTLFGTHNSNVRRGQARVFVVWTRLITPQGYDIPIGSSGGDNLGRAGFGGEVDHHFWQRFGNATLLSLLGATLSNAGVNSNDQPNSADTYREALSISFQSSSTRALEDNVDIPDTIYKDQGEPVIVFVNRDLDFSSVMKR